MAKKPKKQPENPLADFLRVLQTAKLGLADAEYFSKDPHVAETTLPDGKWVSTVKLPFRHPGGIYETMVFAKQGSGRDLDVARFETEELAKAGHNHMVAKWSDRLRIIKGGKAG